MCRGFEGFVGVISEHEGNRGVVPDEGGQCERDDPESGKSGTKAV